MESNSYYNVERLITDCMEKHGFRGLIVCDTRSREQDARDNVIEGIRSRRTSYSEISHNVISFNNGSYIKIVRPYDSIRGVRANRVLVNMENLTTDMIVTLRGIEIPWEFTSGVFSFTSAPGSGRNGKTWEIIFDDLAPEPPDYGEFQCTTEILNYFKELSMEDK